MNLDRLLAHNWPDPLLRFGVRRMLDRKRRKETILSVEEHSTYMEDFVDGLLRQPIAIHTDDANTQHYELPPAFFEAVLGRRQKYSCGYWKETVGMDQVVQYLDRSEEDMLELTCQRAGLANGQDILELGCGWGTLCLYVAEHFPDSRVSAVSNSRFQIEFIAQKAREKGLDNLQVRVADINELETEDRYDRVVSVEMFEHMRNYRLLLEKIAGFLKEEGKLFVHIFTHHTHPFLYEDRTDADWMTRHFFSGGTMPSQDLLHYFMEQFWLEKQWALSGTHYQKTLEAWLRKMDGQKERIMAIFRETYGPEEAPKWWNYWRLFFLSCAEFFGYRDGNEWFVSHYLFSKREGLPSAEKGVSPDLTAPVKEANNE